jgi:hypothetical protein
MLFRRSGTSQLIENQLAQPLQSRFYAARLISNRNQAISPRRMGRYPSGQRGQTVNLLAYAYAGSNPALPTTLTRSEVGQKLGCWLRTRDQQMVPGTSAGYIEKLALRVIDLFEVCIVAHRFNAFL